MGIGGGWLGWKWGKGVLEGKEEREKTREGREFWFWIDVEGREKNINMQNVFFSFLVFRFGPWGITLFPI